MISKLIADLIALEEKACEAPWRVDPDDRPQMEWNNHIMYGPTNNNAVCFMAHSYDGKNSKHIASAHFIVALRNAFPQLLAALSTREETLEEAARIAESGTYCDKCKTAIAAAIRAAKEQKEE